MNIARKILANAVQDLSAISKESKHYDRSLYTYLNLHNSFQLERFRVGIFILTSLSVIGFLNLKESYKIFGVVKILHQNELYFSRYLFLLSCSLSNFLSYPMLLSYTYFIFYLSFLQSIYYFHSSFFQSSSIFIILREKKKKCLMGLHTGNEDKMLQSILCQEGVYNPFTFGWW